MVSQYLLLRGARWSMQHFHCCPQRQRWHLLSAQQASKICEQIANEWALSALSGVGETLVRESFSGICSGFEGHLARPYSLDTRFG